MHVRVQDSVRYMYLHVHACTCDEYTNYNTWSKVYGIEQIGVCLGLMVVLDHSRCTRFEASSL